MTDVTLSLHCALMEKKLFRNFLLVVLLVLIMILVSSYCITMIYLIKSFVSSIVSPSHDSGLIHNTNTQ